MDTQQQLLLDLKADQHTLTKGISLVSNFPKCIPQIADLTDLTPSFRLYTWSIFTSQAGFSIYIMVVGQLESFGQKTAHDLVLHRIREQFVGASVYILVEMLLWRRSARAEGSADLQ